MATIKSYTDLEQSKKLAEILPLESADLSYMSFDIHITLCPYNKMINDGFDEDEVIPCWSLAALLAFLPNSAFLERGSVTELYRIRLPIELVPFNWFVEPIDACYEMILKLNELNLL